MTKTVVRILVSLVVLAAAGLIIWQVVSKQALAAKVTAANVRAASWEIRYNAESGTFEERGTTLLEAQGMNRSLMETNSALAKDLKRQGATLLQLQHTVADIQIGMVGDTTPEITAEGVSVPIAWRRAAAESFFEVTGRVDVGGVRQDPGRPLTAQYDLALTARLGVSTTISRLPEGDLRVDVSSDFPGIAFSIAEVVDNLDDPLLTPQINLKLGAGIFTVGVGAGVAACLATSIC